MQMAKKKLIFYKQNVDLQNNVSAKTESGLGY